MVARNISQEFRLKITHETRNYSLEETKQNELMSIKSKKNCTNINYIQNPNYFSFYNYCMYFEFWFCFFNWYTLAVTSFPLEKKKILQ